MLFTDAPLITLADLSAIDSNLVNVATVENIPTTGTMSFIEQAIEEAAQTLEAHFQNFDYNYVGYGTNIFTVGRFRYGDSAPQPRMILGQVVVDSPTTTFMSPLKKWIAYLAVRNFYQMASERLVNSIYQAKVIQLQKDIDNKYWPNFRKSGLPIVLTPVACPGAYGMIGVGSWSGSNVTTVATGSDAGATYDVSITYVNSQGVESGPSASQTVIVATDHQMVVNLNNLIPNPAQNINNVIGTLPPVNSWNVYVGLTGQTLYRQGSTQPIATTTFSVGTPVLSGTPIGNGQTRDLNLTYLNMLFRG